MSAVPAGDRLAVITGASRGLGAGFSSPDFVAERLLELAFDAAHAPERVLVRLPSEKQ